MRLALFRQVRDEIRGLLESLPDLNKIGRSVVAEPFSYRWNRTATATLVKDRKQGSLKAGCVSAVSWCTPASRGLLKSDGPIEKRALHCSDLSGWRFFLETLNDHGIRSSAGPMSGDGYVV